MPQRRLGERNFLTQLPDVTLAVTQHEASDGGWHPQVSESITKANDHRLGPFRTVLMRNS